ncbi:NUDIX domain-containing protein [Lentzea sp. NPDC034063]|uniref:NUDIX hydrolase n=1 Tax=unclassified Lentzea TaxID=2643253 RepID=UPI0033EB2867
MARVDYFHDPSAPKANSLRPAVSAFIQDEVGRVLMIRRADNDKYAIPGGQQEAGETLTQAAIRETKEETGIDIEVTELIGLYSNPHHIIEYDDGEVRQEFSICFRGSPKQGDLKTSNESKEVAWINLDELDALNIHPSIRMRINHALDNRVDPFYT